MELIPEWEVEEQDRELTCQRCAKTVAPVLLKSGKHIRANCPDCGRYIKFVRQVMTPEDREYWDRRKQNK